MIESTIPELVPTVSARQGRAQPKTRGVSSNHHNHHHHGTHGASKGGGGSNTATGPPNPGGHGTLQVVYHSQIGFQVQNFECPHTQSCHFSKKIMSETKPLQIFKFLCSTFMPEFYLFLHFFLPEKRKRGKVREVEKENVDVFNSKGKFP